jgi:hypothetical protein
MPNKIYQCLYCDALKGAHDTAPHCDQRPQPGEYSHVWKWTWSDSND